MVKETCYGPGPWSLFPPFQPVEAVRPPVALFQPGLLKLESSGGRSAGREDREELVAPVTSGIAAWSGAGIQRGPPGWLGQRAVPVTCAARCAGRRCIGSRRLLSWLAVVAACWIPSAPALQLENQQRSGGCLQHCREVESSSTPWGARKAVRGRTGPEHWWGGGRSGVWSWI